MADQISPTTRPAPQALLVGRDRELAALRDALAAALAGRGSLVLIGGEAGICKTTLAEAALVEATERGALVLVGRCYDLAETPPYGPWTECFTRAPRGDGLRDAPDFAGSGGAMSQAALFTAGSDYLAAIAARCPLVLLLDDLHWADPASLDLLRFLTRGLADLPLLLLATYRADELTRRHPLYQLLPTLVREARAERLDLRPLARASLDSLVGRYALPDADGGRLVAYLAAQAEGNPFFTGELLRALEERGVLRRVGDAWQLGDTEVAVVPPLLRQVIDGRVDRLGETARTLLGIAAVIGQVVPFDVWSGVARADDDALFDTMTRAVEARLLVESPADSGYRFAHALVREVLYEDLPLPRRRALHRRVAELLTATPKSDPDAVADHFRRAGDLRATEWLLAAGERAHRAWAWLGAADRYETALTLMETANAGAGQRAELLIMVAQLRRYSDPRRSVGYLEEAVRLAVEWGMRPSFGRRATSPRPAPTPSGRWPMRASRVSRLPCWPPIVPSVSSLPPRVATTRRRRTSIPRWPSPRPAPRPTSAP